MNIIYLIIVLIYLFVFFEKQKKNKQINNNLIRFNPKLSKSDINHIKMGQRKMSKMLKLFDSICRRHNIRYFLIGGSLIGVLAYGGWIPWDGDVDLEVHENDYNRLKQVLKNELPPNMWFQNKDTDDYYPSKANIIGKVRVLKSC